MTAAVLGKDPGNSRPIACLAHGEPLLWPSPLGMNEGLDHFFSHLLPMTTLHGPDTFRVSPKSLHGEVIVPSDKTASLGSFTASVLPV